MKKYFTIAFVFITMLVFSQNYIVKYRHFEDKISSVANLLINTEVKISLYTNNTKEIVPGTEYFDDDNNLTGNFQDIQEFFFKDFSNKTMLSEAKIKYNMKTILEEPLMTGWKINENVTKEILGLKCIQAKILFRGRNYTAYFTKYKNIDDGPKKFSGLDGLILEVVEDNNKLRIIAEDISISSNKIKNPYLTQVVKGYDEIITDSKIKYHKIKTELEEKYNGIVRTDFSNNLEIYDLN